MCQDTYADYYNRFSLPVKPLLYRCPFTKFLNPNNYNGGRCNKKFCKYNRFSHYVSFVKKEEVMLNKAHREEHQINGD